MSATEALALLGLRAPSIASAAELAAWKVGPLKTAHHATARAVQGSQATLARVHAAREVLELLRVREPTPTPTPTRAAGGTLVVRP